MTGPEHYTNAEADIDNAAHAHNRGSQDDVTYWLGCAQVHATLALAAATGLRDGGGMPSPDWNEWLDTASTVVIPEPARDDPF
jgi:hypothetical protein